MREVRHSDDYGIACCVSYPRTSAVRSSSSAPASTWAKALLLAINEGRCENTGTLMVKGIPALSEGPLRFEEVMRNCKMVLHETPAFNEAMNIIHYMHDKYYYEKAQMALVDTDPHQPRLRRGRSLDRPRLPLGHQIRQGDAHPQRAGGLTESLRHRG